MTANLERDALLRRKGWNAAIERASKIAEHYAQLMKSQGAQRAAEAIRALLSETPASAARESSDPCVVLSAERIEQLRVVLREWSSSEPDRLAIDLGHLCNMAQMCGDAPEPSSTSAVQATPEATAAWAVIRENIMGCKRGGEIHHSLVYAIDAALNFEPASSAPASRESSEPLSDDDFYWLEKLISDVESPDQRKYITGFSPMRLNFMAKMLRRALQNAAPQAVGVGPAIQPSPSDAADRPAGAAPPAACTLDKYKGTPERDAVLERVRNGLYTMRGYLATCPEEKRNRFLEGLVSGAIVEIERALKNAAPQGEGVGPAIQPSPSDAADRPAGAAPVSSMRTEEMSASDPTRTQPPYSARAGTEPCSYCGVGYPKPVSYHHSTEECRANEKASSTRATPVAYAWIDDASDRMRRAKAWLDVAADSGIDAKDEMGLPTPNAEGCALLAAEIDSLLSGVPTPNRDLGFGSPADKAAGIASASPSSTRATGNTPRCDALDEEIVQIRMARGVSLGRDLKEFKMLARQLERELAEAREELALTQGTLESRERNIEDMTRTASAIQLAPAQRSVLDAVAWRYRINDTQPWYYCGHNPKGDVPEGWIVEPLWPADEAHRADSASDR